MSGQILDRHTFVLLLARILMSAVRATSGVVVPVYLAQLGYRALWIGTLFVAVGLVSAALSVSIGWWADHLGCKPFVVALPILTGAAAAAYAVSANPVVLVVAAAAGSFGRGSGAGAAVVGPYQPAEQALLAALTGPKNRSRVFAIFASGSAAGALIGSLLALVPQVAGSAHVTGPGPYSSVFWVLAALGVGAGLLALPITEPAQSESTPAASTPADSTPAESPRPTASRTRARRPLTPWSRRLLFRLWASNLPNGIAIGLFGPFVSFWLHDRFGVGVGEIGVLFAVINVVTMATNLGADRVARRLGTVRAIVFTRLMQGLLLIPMVLMPTFVAAGAVYLVRMVIQRLGMPVRQSYIMGLTDPGQRARITSLSRLPSQLLTAVAPPFSGYLLQEVSLALPFGIAGGFQMLGAGLFWVFFRRIPADTDVVRDEQVEGPRHGSTPR